MANYCVDDNFGTLLTAGLSEFNARSEAQKIANRLGETVWLYETGSDEPSIEIKPKKVKR